MDPWFIIYLGIAHWLADFVFQTDWMAVNKSKRWDALVLHTAVYSAAMGLLTLPALWSNAGWFAMVTFVAHLATDAVTSRIGRAVFPWSGPHILPEETNRPIYIDYEGMLSESPWALCLRRSRHWFFTVIGADQWLLHWPQLVLTAYYLL